MARFLHVLNREIAGIVEMQYYVELTNMMHQVIKVEILIIYLKLMIGHVSIQKMSQIRSSRRHSKMGSRLL